MLVRYGKVPFLSFNVLRKLVSSVPGLHGRESHLSNQVAILGAINSVAKGDNGDVSVHSL